MAEINFEIYKTQPFYLHHKLEDFYRVYNKNVSKIERYGERFLITSINKQRDKEKYIYKILGLEEGNWREIGSKIFGVFNADENEENRYYIENKFELFLKRFTEFINDRMKQTAISFNKKNNLENALKNESYKKPEKRKQIINAANDFIRAYNSPVKEFLSWYKSSGLSKGEFNESELDFLEKIFEKSRKNREKLLDPNDNRKLRFLGEESLEEAINLLYSSGGIIGNIVGDVGEAATIKYAIGKKNYLINSVGTSLLRLDEDETAKKQNITLQNKQFYERTQKEINKQLNEAGVKLRNDFRTEDGCLNFGYTYSESNTNTLSKNLKADEIFNFEVYVGGKWKKISYGVSSKTSWTENGSLKLYSGSFFSSLENLFKSNIIDAGIIGEIVNFLIYLIFNSYGVASYGSYIGGKTSIGDYNPDSYIYSNTVSKYKKNKKRKFNIKSEYESDFYFDYNKTFKVLNYNYTKNSMKIKEKIDRKTGEVKKTFKIEENYEQGLFSKLKTRPLYNLIIQDFAYQWFTGGISPATHADFFSVYSGGIHYFVPMSVILEVIKNANDTEDFLLTSNMVSTLSLDTKKKALSNNPLSLEDYQTTWKYNEMEEKGINILDKSGTIVANKEKLFKNLI